MMPPQTLVVGLGSDFGDDRVGWVVAQRLSAMLSTLETRLIGSPAELLDQLTGIDVLHLVDACRGAGQPGTIVRCEWPTPELTQIVFQGSHDLGLAAALAIAERLGLLPPRVTIWGVELGSDPRDCAAATSFSAPLSPGVSAAVDALVTRLERELAADSAPLISSVPHA